jgi:hypothetical protein
MTAEDLTRRVADELEIRNVIATLAVLSDGGDLDEYASLFTEDAHWEMKTEGDTANPFPTVDGRANILSAAKQRRANTSVGPGSHNYHCIFSTAVKLNGNAASTTTYLAYVKNARAAPQIAMFRIYRDQFVRTPGGWKVSLRYVDLG